MLNILRPTKAPGFAYAWLEIVSHRVFIGRILSLTPQQKGWPMYAQVGYSFISSFIHPYIFTNSSLWLADIQYTCVFSVSHLLIQPSF